MTNDKRRDVTGQTEVLRDKLSGGNKRILMRAELVLVLDCYIGKAWSPYRSFVFLLSAVIHLLSLCPLS